MAAAPSSPLADVREFQRAVTRWITIWNLVLYGLVIIDTGLGLAFLLRAWIPQNLQNIAGALLLLHGGVIGAYAWSRHHRGRA